MIIFYIKNKMPNIDLKNNYYFNIFNFIYLYILFITNIKRLKLFL